MRILRKRIVLGVIFALSLTYCILSFLREVRIFVHNDHSHKVIDITFEQIIHILSSIRNWLFCDLPKINRTGYVPLLLHYCKARGSVPKTSKVHELT